MPVKEGTKLVNGLEDKLYLELPFLDCNPFPRETDIIGVMTRIGVFV
jgi:hypothetical protein